MINVCVIDIETINIIRRFIVIYCNNIAERDNMITDIRFICMPGSSPVNVPMIQPRNKARIISISILI